MTTPMYPNNLHVLTEKQKLCKAFGVKVMSSPTVVQVARAAGFDALFVDLEHSTLSLDEASRLCTAGLLAGITPFVRVPHQCGNGFVQRVLDGGAMGVIFPHISSRAEAESAVLICKYPPQGKRSITGQLPQFGMLPQPQARQMSTSNATGSTVFVMLETAQGIADVDAIAGVPGVHVLLVGSNDLSIELGVPGQFESDVFREALKKVSRACKAHGKIMGLAGVYDRVDIQRWAVRELGVGFMLGQQDLGLVTKGARACVEALEGIQ